MNGEAKVGISQGVTAYEVRALASFTATTDCLQQVRQMCLQVHQIFAEKPAVKRAFQATVPTRMMTNQQFWAKYLKHQVLAQVSKFPSGSELHRMNPMSLVQHRCHHSPLPNHFKIPAT